MNQEMPQQRARLSAFGKEGIYEYPKKGKDRIRRMSGWDFFCETEGFRNEKSYRVNIQKTALSCMLAASAALCAPNIALAYEDSSKTFRLGEAMIERESHCQDVYAHDGEDNNPIYVSYKGVLQRALLGAGEFESIFLLVDRSQWSPEYFIYDIGNNGTPELFVRTSIFPGVNMVSVFSIKNNNAVLNGTYWEWFGKTAGNDSGDLFVAGSNQGSSYVNSILIEKDSVVSRFIKSLYTDEENSNTGSQTVSDFLTLSKSNWISSLHVNDDSLLKKYAQLDLERADISVGSGGVYTGLPQTPSVTVKFNGTTLKRDKDYKVVYMNNINAGIATAQVIGTNEYQGSINKTFTISPAGLSSALLTSSDAGTYDGSQKTPAVSVVLGTKLLKKDVDYKVTYSNNINAGKGTAIITGIGNYSGWKNITFTIGAADISRATRVVSSAGSYTGAAKQPDVTVKYGSRILKNGTDFKVSYKNNTKAGTAIATITGIGNYWGSVSSSFVIEGASVANAKIDIASVNPYNGSAKTPRVAVKVGNVNLVKNTDYRVQYKNNIGAGKGIVEIVGLGNYAGMKVAQFTIEKATNSMTVNGVDKTISIASLEKGDVSYRCASISKAPQGTVQYQNANPASFSKYFSFNEKTGVITIKKGTKAGTYNLKFKVGSTGNANYKGIAKMINCKVVVK